MYPPHHLGGYELSCRDTCERWRARGHDVTVLTTTMRLPGVVDPPDERAHGVRRELGFYWADHQIVCPPLHRRVALERANQRALAKAIDDVRPDVVSAWHMGAMSLALLTTVVERGIPLVLVVCDDWLWYGPHVDAWTKLFRGRPMLGKAARMLTGLPTEPPDLGEAATFLFVSDTVRRLAEERSPWHARIATVVYSGIEPADFAPADPADEHRWRWRLLSVGRLDERKGVHVAVEALTHLPEEATLDILGRGDARYEARLRELAGRLGLAERVRFGVVERSALRDRYLAADVCVFPTIWDEPFGLVPVEAMACRTPVVATGTGGSGEFLRDGVNCVIVPPRDPEALAAAVRRLHDDPALRERILAGGDRTARELTADRLADVQEAWHVAAAAGFAGGRPADRPPVWSRP